MVLAVCEADRLDVIVAVERPGEAHGGVLAAGEQHERLCVVRHRHYRKIIWVQRKSAMVLPVSATFTSASHTCVVRPRWTGRAVQATVPVSVEPRKFDFSSKVVKPWASSGRLRTVA